MDTYYVGLILFFGFIALISSVLSLWLVWKQKKQHEMLAQMPFEIRYRKLLMRTPHYPCLSEEERERIERAILRFIHTKEFVGVKMNVTDEMKVLIAFYACLLLLHIETKNCYDNLHTVILYPDPVHYNTLYEHDGVYTQEKMLINGQSANDTVILVWRDVRYEACHLQPHNVIIHEFAHELDFMSGEVDGTPPLKQGAYQRWVEVFEHCFHQLTYTVEHYEKSLWGAYALFGDYAAKNRSEFFAVATERFFESPYRLKNNFPELYAVLKSFYGTDPVVWLTNDGGEAV